MEIKFKYIFTQFCSVIFLMFNLNGYAQMQPNDSFKMDIFLNNAMLKDASINVKLINAIDYTPTGFLFLASSNQFYLFGLDNMTLVFNESKTTIDAFAVTQDDMLWVVSGDELCYMDSLGNLSTLYKLPVSNTGIVSGNNENVAYIYDRTLQEEKNEYAIYQISDKQYTRLASTTTPILSAYEYKTSLLFSSENRILCADSETQTFFDFFVLPQKQHIISITGDTINHALYFSTQDTVYRIQNGQLEYICMEFGGTLKYDGEGLLVFNPENSLIVRFRNNILYPPVRETEDLPQLTLSLDSEQENRKLTMLLDRPRDLILLKQIPEAIQAYAQLAKKEEANSTILLEYAYALALGGVYKGALMNLDKAKLSGAFSEKFYFFAGQILALMGHNRPAIELLTQSAVPRWIYSTHDKLYKNYRSNAFISREKELDVAFSRVNYLVANNMDFQAIALFEQIIDNSPDDYLLHVGYSIPLEKVGLRQMAAEEMKTGLELLPNDTQDGRRKRMAFNERLVQLKQKSNTKQTKQPESKGMKSQGMAYLGGSFSQSYSSLNARFGWFFTNSFNASIDFGILNTADDTSGNIGLSLYQRLGKVLVIGAGVIDQITEETNIVSIRPTIGLSFLNKKKTSSWDIFFDVYCPVAENANYLYGFSIGKSFYFGKRRLP